MIRIELFDDSPRALNERASNLVAHHVVGRYVHPVTTTAFLEQDWRLQDNVVNRCVFTPRVGFKKNVNRATTQVMMKTGHVEKTNDRDYEVEERYKIPTKRFGLCGMEHALRLSTDDSELWRRHRRPGSPVRHLLERSWRRSCSSFQEGRRAGHRYPGRRRAYPRCQESQELS